MDYEFLFVTLSYKSYLSRIEVQLKFVLQIELVKYIKYFAYYKFLDNMCIRI